MAAETPLLPQRGPPGASRGATPQLACIIFGIGSERLIIPAVGKNQPQSGRTLHLERTLAASPERVFAACVEAERLAEWWGPAGFTSPSVQLDVRKGGRYRITMRPPEGDAFHLRGEFREVAPPRRLVYTFVWEEPDPDDQETVVTMTFERVGENTKLSLDQSPFKTDARYELHEGGWTETLDRLERSLARAR